MTRLDHSPEIIELAAILGVRGGTPVDDLLDHCRRRIDGWVAEAGGVTSIDALESLVTRRLQMVFEEVRADDDWDRLREVYARGKKEFVFAGLRPKFEDDSNPTFGALTGVGNPREGVLVETKGKRVRVYDRNEFLEEVASKFPTSLRWPNHGLPSARHVLLAGNLKAFTDIGDEVVSHGGIALEEVLVPFVAITREET